jgi:prevent-host-death family protein
MIWQLQDAKNKFSELVEEALAHGPQTVTKRGQEAVVVMSIQDYKRLSQSRGSVLAVFRKAAPLADGLDLSRDPDATVRDIAL